LEDWGKRRKERERSTYPEEFFLVVCFFFFFSWLEDIWKDARLQKGTRDVDDPFKQNSLQV